jgi:hypothetical protein
MKQLKLLTVLVIVALAITFAFGNVQKAQAQPTNDEFVDATVVYELPFDDTVIVDEATTNGLDPYPCGYPPGNSVWYAFTPTADMYVTISTEGTTYNTGIGVFTGVYGSLDQVNCTTDNRSMNTFMTAGITYFIEAVALSDPYPGSENRELHLHLSQVSGPANDNFADARLISEFPYNDEVDITVASTEQDEPFSGCAWWGSVYRTIWYVYTPSTRGIVRWWVGTNFPYYLYTNVYTGSSFGDLTSVVCSAYPGDQPQFEVTPGTTYYIQIGSHFMDSYGTVTPHFELIPPPPNDNFTSAEIIGSIPFSSYPDNSVASVEPGEPNCIGGELNRTIWYAYTPEVSGSITVEKNGFFYSFVGVYTGDSLETLTNIRCQGYGQNKFTFYADAGETVYFQLGGFVGWDFGQLYLWLSVPPPPTVDFWYSPGDPSRLDSVQFCDSSSDPGNESFTHFWWNFGDGVLLEATGGCVTHQFNTDGDFTVWHKAQTYDGRTAEVTKVVSVRTHDVAITKFSVPQSAKVGQTKTITVGIRNNRYPETVTVELYKSTPNGYAWVGYLTMYVPVRPSNRTTDFIFSYTFTNEDAQLGKMNFGAFARLDSARDVYPTDNEGISLPVKLSGYVPYKTTLVNPSNMAGILATIGIMAAGLLAALAMFFGTPFPWLWGKR